MGRAADACCIQYRMLNRGKGPAVHSLRAQADRRLYQQYMKHVLELQDNLDLKQAMVTELLVTKWDRHRPSDPAGSILRSQSHHSGHWYLFGQHHHHRQLRHILRS